MCVCVCVCAHKICLSAGAVEYTNCFSAGG